MAEFQLSSKNGKSSNFCLSFEISCFLSKMQRFVDRVNGSYVLLKIAARVHAKFVNKNLPRKFKKIEKFL